MDIAFIRRRIEEIKTEQRKHLDAAQHPTDLWRRDVELAQVEYYEQDLHRWIGWLSQIERREQGE